MATLTLDDLAKMAGVSPKTISRVVNNLPGVGPKKREAIQRLIRETGFRPNFGARVLASSRNYIVGMLVERQTSHYYYAELQIGISQACIENGYHLVVESVLDLLDKGSDAFRGRFGGLQPDGVLLVPPVSESLHFMEALADLKVPYVRIAPVENLSMSSSVSMDDERASYEITKYLIGLGHRRLAWMSVAKRLASMKQREAGFMRALAEAGIEQPSEYRLPAPESPDSGYKMAYQLLTLPNRPTALVCGNDSNAVASIGAANRLGMAVPADVSIVGFDNSPGSESCWPPLTTVNQPISSIGKRAAEILFRHLDRDRPFSGLMNEQVDYELVIRESAAAPPLPAVSRTRRSRTAR